MWWDYKPYVSVAQRRAKAAKEIQKLQRKGRTVHPVRLDGKAIARTFWGKAWCDNLESYSDYDNRLPRGRTYVRNGSVCDLQIAPGCVTALVCGSELYEIKIAIKPLPAKSWSAIKRQCAGQIGSLIELLQGKFSQGVMQVITRRDAGLFPKPAEIDLDCSCPDWADMCKHVAAVLYGVGARLDEQPELLFVLRRVDHMELIRQAGDAKSLTRRKRAAVKTIAADALSDVFGIDLEPPTASQPATSIDHVSEVPASAGRKRAPKTDGTTPARRRGRAGDPPGQAATEIGTSATRGGRSAPPSRSSRHLRSGPKV
jgi:uncharacterized Zn finger protein